jgi:hypothetical protein
VYYDQSYCIIVLLKYAMVIVIIFTFCTLSLTETHYLLRCSLGSASVEISKYVYYNFRIKVSLTSFFQIYHGYWQSRTSLKRLIKH